MMNKVTLLMFRLLPFVEVVIISFPYIVENRKKDVLQRNQTVKLILINKMRDGLLKYFLKEVNTWKFEVIRKYNLEKY